MTIFGISFYTPCLRDVGGPLLNGPDDAHCFTRGGLSYWARSADCDFVNALKR